MRNSPALPAALVYLARGFLVIPIRHKDKRPLLPWREYQARRPNRTEVVSWFKRWPNAGIAIVCGAVSGLAVLDCDPRNGNGLQAPPPGSQIPRPRRLVEAASISILRPSRASA